MSLLDEKNGKTSDKDGGPGTKMSKTTRLILVALGLMLISSIGASLLQSNFGRVRIQDIGGNLQSVTGN